MLKPRGAADWPSAATAWLGILVLMLAGLVGIMDHQIFNLVVDPIRHSLGFSDVQIGVLQGFAFTLSFIAFGLPTPAADPHQMLGDLMVLAAALAWGATTIVIKARSLSRVSAEKTALYQLVVSAPILGLGALLLGEHMDAVPSALSIAAMASAEKKFNDQVDSNGKPILVSPTKVLVGTTLKGDAQNIFDEKVIINGSSSKDTPAKNKMYNKYRPVVSPYMDNTNIKDQDGKAITGQSATRWHMLCDPAVRAALAVAFLNGQQTPTIQSSEAEFNVLGMQWRAFHDFGVGMEETTAAVMSDAEALEIAQPWPVNFTSLMTSPSTTSATW